MKFLDWIDRKPLAVAFGLGGAGGTGTATQGAPADFDGLLDIGTSSITDPAITYLRTAGYAVPGDGGAALYVRAGSEPAHDGKVRSADGTWWELSASIADTAQFGNSLDMALGYAVAKGIGITVSQSCALANSAVLGVPLDVTAGAQIAPAAGAVLTIDQKMTAGCQQVFDLGLGGDVDFTHAQDVFPEWFGMGDTALSDAFKKSAAGSRIRLRGILYDSIAITVDNNPLAPDGADTGKIIEGPAVAQRYNTTGDFFGARIRLVAGQNTDLFTVSSSGANEFGSGGLRNVMLQGNKAGNTGGAGVRLLNVKDWELHNVYVWDFDGDGLNFDGANNQINLTGFIECWNNGRDGIRGAAIGDPQWAAAIRCVNNARYGFYLAGGFGRINQIYCYFNTVAGFLSDTSATDNLHIDYLRVEDNDGVGARIRGANLTIDSLEAADNGIAGTVDTDRTGLWLDGCRDVTISNVASANRTAAVHNQKFLVYDGSVGGCSIGKVNNDAYGVHGIAGEQTLFAVNPGQLSGLSVAVRKSVHDTYSNLRNANATVTPAPDNFSFYRIDGVDEDTEITDTDSSRATAGMELAFEITATGTRTVTWDPVFADISGADFAAQVVPAGQTLNVCFRRQGGRWFQTTPLLIE